MNEWIAILIGVVITLNLASLTRMVVGSVSIKAPIGVDKELWDKLFTSMGGKSTRYLGFIEALLFFASFLLGANVAVGALLGFKLASKWHVWNHIIKVPDEVPNSNDKSALGRMDSSQFLLFRNHWGTTVLGRFLIGTLFNVLAGLVGAVVTRGFVGKLGL